MKSFCLALGLGLAMSTTLGAQKTPPVTPKLVVGIVVDQMRYDYIYRFQDRFSAGGFKRFLNQGFNFKNCHYNYVPTYTGPGHACIYTGTTPAVNGIVANDWWDREKGAMVYCAEDKTVKTVGSASLAGQMSPANLLSNTVTDELRLASNYRSKVVGVALKDRGAILPAGHTPTGAYWFDGATGNFITSTFYTNDLPAWVNTFNQQHLAQSYLTKPWETFFPAEVYANYCSADNVTYEQVYKGETAPTFPHNVPAFAGGYNADLIRALPAGNTLSRQFAEAAITGEQLGTDSVTDFLTLSFSSTDYVGHQFGPRSWELADTYFRLDRELETFFAFLDKTVGKGKYTVFLSADHGAVENYAYANEHKLPGGYFDAAKADTLIRDFFVKTYKADLMESFVNSNIYLNHKKIEELKLNLTEVQNATAAFVLNLPHVMNALTADQVRRNDSPESMESRIKRGYLLQRGGDIVMTLQVGYTEAPYPKGTTHGVGYEYDTHVPCLWYGANVPVGESVTPVQVSDIAPSVSVMLNIAFPNGCTGTPLLDLFKK